MPNLFDSIPPGLFRPLAAQGAPIYADVLLRLFAETQRHLRPISRDLAVRVISDILSNPEALEMTSDVVAGETPPPTITAEEVDARAAAILRYLTQCGWFRIETQHDFSHLYTLPMHAFRLLNVLQDITDNHPPRLQGIICAIHDLLLAAVQEGSDAIRFQEAYHQTRFLLTSLKELQHNIGIHIQDVLEKLKARDVLEHIFTSYRKDIVDTAYHQLRTTDHVSRFRPGVFQALTALREDEGLETMAKQLVIRGEAQTFREASTRLVEQIRAIREQFETLDSLLESIDVRHSQFVDSAVRSIEHYLMASSTTSGQIQTILEQLIASLKQKKQSDAADDGDDGDDALLSSEPFLELFSLELFDTGSLAAPTRAAVPFEPDDIPLEVITQEELEDAHQQTLRQLGRAMSRQRVQHYAMELLSDREQVTAVDIPIRGPEDLPLLIYLRAYGDGSLGYEVETPEEEDAHTWIERDGIGLRNFLLKRKTE